MPTPIYPEEKNYAYPDLPKGKLLYDRSCICGGDGEEVNCNPKEYITLGMNESKEFIKKVLDEKGRLKGHPEIPCSSIDWGDMPAIDLIQEAIDKEFPSARRDVTENVNRVRRLLAEYLGRRIELNYKQRITVDDVETKFDIRDVNGAVHALGKILSEREAERIVAKEMAKKINSVL